MQQSLEPPNLNLPGDTSKIKHEDSVLPSIQQDHHSAKSVQSNPDDHAAAEGEHEVERYPVTTVDFSRVETPFIIGIWILFASIAKIGKSTILILSVSSAK